MAELSPPAWVEQGANHARSARLLSTALTSGGVWNPGDLAVSNPSGVNLSVAAGGAFVAASSAGNGAFACYNDAGVSLSVPTLPAFQQVSIVVAQVEAREFGDAQDRWYLRVVSGGSGGAVPATPNNSLLLAQVTVNAAASTISSLVDKRVYSSTKGSVATVTSGTRGSGHRPGQIIWESDTNRPLIYDGTAWRRLVVSADAVSGSVQRVLAGTTQVSFTAAQLAQTVVTFPAGMFASAPRVAATVSSSSGGALGSTVLIFNKTNTGMTVQLRLTAATTASFAVEWIAVESDT